MNGFLGDGWYSEVAKKDGVRNPDSTMFFCEENIWMIPQVSVIALNNNHLIGRTKPYGSNDYNASFATFHNMEGNDRDSGNSNAVFLDGHLETVENEDTFKLGWPLRFAGLPQ